MSRKGLLLIAVAMAATAVILSATGGTRATIGGLQLSMRSPAGPSVAAGAALAAWWLAAHFAGRVTRDLDEVWGLVERQAGSIILCLALGAAAIAVHFGTFAASGADASGYLSQAALWASGRLSLPDSLSAIAGWPANPSITAPLGWRPAIASGSLVPTYGPGLPLLLSLPLTAGGPLAACLAIAVASGLSVWLAGTMATRLAGGVAGIVAALLLATSPVLLFQSVQPMSDVPVTAAWLLCWWSLAAGATRATPDLSAGLAGIAAAVAVAIRPNLAPLAALPFVALALAPSPAFARLAPRGELRRGRAEAAFGREGGHLRTLAPLLFAVPVIATGLFLALLQWRWYGSPLGSGYGTTDELFALANVIPNSIRYAGWLAATSPALLLAPVGVLIARGATLTWWMAGFAALVVAAYLVYGVFDNWSYLRFLLPALGIGAVFVAVLCSRVLAQLPSAFRLGGLCAIAFAMTAQGVSEARTRDVFRLAAWQQRIIQLGGYLEAALPESAAVITGEQSGAVAFYTGQQIVRWEAASAAELVQVEAALAAQGRPLWIVLDAWEEAPFRAKFAAIPLGALDWPPIADAGDSHRTRAWRVTDRDRFRRGDRVATDRLR